MRAVGSVEPGLAARLVGASEGQRVQLGIPGGPADAHARERITEQLRSTLGGERFDEEMNFGRELSRDEVFALAAETARSYASH